MKYFCLTVFIIILSCNDKPQNQVKKAVVTFTKNADLHLIKKGTDSIYKTLAVEIADTPYKRETGLMYRDSMEENQGMLFVFSDMMPRSFYMKNTRFALDIIYLNDKKEIVSFQKNAQPFNEASLPSQYPAQYVLEINAGLSDAWGLEVGDSIDWVKTE